MGTLNDKTALITGGGTGIGLAIARGFHQQGAWVMICGRREELLKEACHSISPGGERVGYVPADVTCEEDVQRAVQRTVQQAKGIDILVNNAGIMRFGNLEEVEVEQWQELMSTNAYGPWRMMKAVIPAMRQREGGSIVNISSIAGIKVFPGSGIYCASKAALQMISQVMALEVAADRIRVNLICPALVEGTELADPIFGKENVEDFYAKVRPLHPLGRSGKPMDIAQAALFLASEQSSWITGAILPVDGGRHMATNRPSI